MTSEQFKKMAKKLPGAPGVYFFLGPRKEVLYIGKATSLRDRVRSYFSADIAKTRGPLIVSMLEKARSIDWRVTDSVLEALILEANLIKTYKPKGNTDLKDDKSWNYVVITKEDFPRVLLVRGKELVNQRLRRATPQKRGKSSAEDFPMSGAVAPPNISSGFSVSPLRTFGPFPHGGQLKEALRLIRKIFPYSDSCTPCEALAKQGKPCKPCFNRQLGLCPGVCAGDISKTEYRKIVRRITLLFQGKKKELLKNLRRDMKKAAKEEQFEEATRLRRQVFALEHIQDVSLIKDEYRAAHAGVVGSRVEAYDVAHLAGSAVVGVMTVVEDGEANRQEYRKFRIRSAKGGDDTGALREILSRRLGHDEWPMPRLVVVDGAAAQVNAAEAVLRQYGIGIPVVGVVKDEKHRPRKIKGLQELFSRSSTPLGVNERDILLANAEAHRFAISYHRRKLRSF